MKNQRLRKIINLAMRPDILRRSLMVSLIVGTVLNLINQGEMLFDPGAVNLWKCALTYAVPYCVATYGSVMSLLSIDE